MGSKACSLCEHKSRNWLLGALCKIFAVLDEISSFSPNFSAYSGLGHEHQNPEAKFCSVNWHDSPAPVRVGRGILAHVGCPGRPSQLTFFQVKLQQCLAPACAPGGVKIPGAVTSPSSVTARATELPRSRYRRRGMNATFRRSFARADPRRPSRLPFFQLQVKR